MAEAFVTGTGKAQKVGDEQVGLSGADEQAPGRVVAGRYRLERVLGRGGMGVVWLAVDTLIERRVALKELRTPVAGEDEASFVERALREARSAGRLSHPGVVGVHDVIAPADEDDPVYIVMEYVEAPTLGEVLDQQGPLPPSRVAAMGVGILDALMAAHAMGIVHRDIKPANVLVGDGDRIKLTDFGIALAAEDTRLTRSGVIGTHGYLAPECFDTGEVGPATDLWALGATLFHAVAGQAPFDRDTPSATLRAILLDEPPAPPCEPALAGVISGLLTRPIDHRLTADIARQQLHHVATTVVDPTPTTGGAGQPGWQVQATTFQRRPPAPPPPPPAPPPPRSPGPTNRANRGVWMIALGLAATVLLVGAIMLVTMGDEGDGANVSDSEGSPQGVARQYFSSIWVTGDCAVLPDLMSEGYLAEGGGSEAVLDDCETAGVTTGLSVGETSLIDESGDTASVEMTGWFELPEQGRTRTTWTVELVVEDGEWKIDNVGQVTDVADG